MAAYRGVCRARAIILARSIVIAAMIAALLVFASRPVPARDQGTDTEKSGVEMITPKTAEAIQKGLDFLGSRQQDDGSFSGSYGRNVAVVSLGGMAFIGSGSTPGRGPYGRQVDKCIDYILSHTEQSGFINFAPQPDKDRCTATVSPQCFWPNATACRSVMRFEKN